jgi:demethylmenaquinone methyltransferase/2-methoxy-6-polyprenyl-1,4-benzoquinol methylase
MTTDKNPEKIANMFDNIAHSYDRNNNIISLGLHKKVKELALSELNYENEMKILDICSGTGDIEEILLGKKYNLDITGVDFSNKMLDVARQKFFDKIHFICADAANLPFSNNVFDIITMTFGLRNIQNREKAIQEAYRVLKPSGQILHLDFGVKNFPSKVFDFVAKSGIKLFYGNKLPYEYLINSKREFPQPEELVKEFESAGFKLKKRKDYLLGVISAQIYIK